MEYIESTGTQYIDTGVVPANGFGFEVDVMPLTEIAASLSVASPALILGTSKRNGGSWGGIDLATWQSHPQGQLTWFKRYTGSPSHMYDPGFVAYTRCTMRNINNHFTSSTGKDYDTPYVTDSEINGNLYLFAINSDADEGGYRTDAGVRLYSCKLYNGTTPVRDFVPAKRKSDSAIGMYDTVSGNFFENAGTGSFIAGPEVVEETYTELEYIDIPANTGFNTNVYLNGNMDIEYEAMIIQRVFVGQFGGARSEAVGGAGFNFPYNYNHPTNGTNMLVDFFGSQNSNGRWTIQRNGSTYVPEANKKYKLSIINKVGTFSVDGTVIDTHTFVGSGIPNTVPYGIHATYNVDTFYYEYEDTIRFYHFSASGVADIVPAKRDSDNVLGLYNKTTGEFLEKIGSGTITAGPAVAQPTTVEIIWGGLSEPDASGMCVYGETFTAPSTAPTAPSGLKFLGWIPR